ncbi:autotransporter outer membrane beta-barrel domain-containing protein [Enterobacteriaceae bacterium LUAb1]
MDKVFFSKMTVLASLPLTFMCNLLHAAVISGNNQHSVVNSTDPAEKWVVSKGATLTINDKGQSDTIELNSKGSLYADGANISSNTLNSLKKRNLLLIDDAYASIKNSVLNYSYSTATDVLMSIQDDGDVDISDSTINASSGRAILVNHGALNISGTEVTVGRTSSTSAKFDGMALFSLGGEIKVDNSKLTGQFRALTIMQDTANYSEYKTTATFSNSALISKEGAAIHVGYVINKPGTSDAIGIIELKDNTIVQAGNGNLLEVENDGHADLTINNSRIDGNIIVDQSSRSSGIVSLINHASLTGSVSDVNTFSIDDSSEWNITASSTVDELTNSGTIAFDNTTVGRTLTVSGNYHGDNGLLVLNGNLQGDNSLIDRFIVNGDTSGTTKVKVNNLGGKGDQTVNGIEVIRVNGKSEGTFTQEGRIVAGAYDYHLMRGGDNQESHWYLTSKFNDGGGGNEEGNGAAILRPEAGAYIANVNASQTLFDTRLADRQRGTTYTDAKTGLKHYSALWMKNTGSHLHTNDKSGQLRSNANSYVLLIGGDIASGRARHTGSWHLGLMGGYGYSHSSNASKLTGYHAKGTVNGYTSGIYGTWYQNGSNNPGAYLDTVLQYNFFKNSVKGDDINGENYHSRGVQASVEGGYVYNILSNYYIQPHARLVWSGVHANDHTEKNGTRVKKNSDHNIRSQIGSRVFAKINQEADQQGITPFAEVNWIHNTQDYSVSMDDMYVSQAGSRNIGEFSVGVEGELFKNLNLTTSVTQQVGEHHYSNTAGSLGIRYNF